MKRNEKYNIKFALSLAITKNLFLYKGNLYEKLENHPYQEQYRIFLGRYGKYISDEVVHHQYIENMMHELNK